MQYKSFQEFDAFAASVDGLDCTMMLQNPKRRIWSICNVTLPEVYVQLGRLGSGNIVEGQSFSNEYILYLPLTDRCEYSANGTVVDTNSFMMGASQSCKNMMIEIIREIISRTTTNNSLTKTKYKEKIILADK